VELTKARGDFSLLEEYNSHDLRYTPNGGSDDLKEAIAELYGPDISKDNVLVFPGGQVAIQVAAQAFCQKARLGKVHSIVFLPGYQSTVESPQWMGGDITKLWRTAANNWQIDLQQLKAAIRCNTSYLIVNEPHNPSGIVMNQQLQTELIALCQEHNIAILSDEVYRLLEHSPETQIPAMADAYPQAGISCVSMSKPWGACGITIGWLVCANLDIIERLWDCQYFGTACTGRACEIQALMVLRASDKILEDRRTIIRNNKALLQSFIEVEYSEFFEWVRPNAGAIAFVKFKGPLNSLELGRLLAKRGISIKPSYCFVGNNGETKNPNQQNLDDWFRIGFGERIMPQALEALKKVVEECKDEWREEMRKNIPKTTGSNNQSTV